MENIEVKASEWAGIFSGATFNNCVPQVIMPGARVNIYTSDLNSISHEKPKETEKTVEANTVPEKGSEPVTDEKLLRKIELVRPRINAKRQWFSVLRYMMWHKIVAEGDFRAALEKLEELSPGLDLDIRDMQRLNVQSFSKSLDKWDINNAPVFGNAFAKYYAIAEMMESA